VTKFALFLHFVTVRLLFMTLTVLVDKIMLLLRLERRGDNEKDD